MYKEVEFFIRWVKFHLKLSFAALCLGLLFWYVVREERFYL